MPKCQSMALINKNIKTIASSHLNNVRLASWQTICQPDDIAKVTDGAVLGKLAHILDRLVLQASPHYLAKINTKDDWQAVFRTLLTHSAFTINSSRDRHKVPDLMALMNSAANFINHLTLGQANQWRQDVELMTGLYRLLEQSIAYVSREQFSTTVVNLLKSFDSRHDDHLYKVIKPKIIDYMNQHAQHFTSLQSARCLRMLAKWCLCDAGLAADNMSLLNQLYQHSQILSRRNLCDDSRAKFERSLVQSFYYLKVHDGLSSITKNDSIIHFEKQLLNAQTQISQAERVCLDYTQDQLGQTIYRQVLCCGYPVDGVLMINNQPCVIEIDGPHHKLDKQARVDRMRDYLLSQWGYWVVRVDLTKMDWVNEYDITHQHVARHLYFLPSYLKDLASLQTLKAEKELGSFIKKVVAPSRGFKTYHDRNQSSLVAQQALPITDMVTPVQQSTKPEAEVTLAQLSKDDFKDIETLFVVLAKHGMSHRAKDESGNTLLHYAVDYQQEQTACALLEHDMIDVTQANSQSETAWAIAKRHDNQMLMARIKQALTYQLADCIVAKHNSSINHLLEFEPDIDRPIYSQANLLHLAVFCANEQAVKQLLPYCSSLIDSRDEAGRTLLHKAALAKSSGIVTYLLDHTALAINAQDDKGRTALHYAAMEDDLNVIDELLVHGADLAVVSYVDESVYDLAFLYASKQTQQHLLLNLDSRLLDAIKQNDCERLDKLIDAIPSIPSSIEYKDIPEASLLTYAMFNDALISFEHLLNNHLLDPCHDDGVGLSVLHYACCNDEVAPDYVELLLHSPRIDVNLQGKETHVTPLHLAIEYGQIEKAQCLLVHPDIDLTRVNCDNQNPLHWAMMFNDGCLGRQMLDQLAQQSDEQFKQVTECHDVAGFTPFHAALTSCNLTLVQYIVQHYAPDFTSVLPIDDSYYPIHLVVQTGDVDIFDYLVHELNIDMTKQDKEGNNVLHYAAVGGKDVMANHLISHYTLDVSAPNASGDTPLHIAADNGFMKVVNAYMVPQARDAILLHNDQGHTVLDLARLNHNKQLADSLQRMLNELLTYVVQEGRSLEYVDRLIEGGAQLDYEVILDQGRSGFIIHYAAYYGQTDIVKHLIDCHDEPWDSCADRGKEPLHYALSKGHLDTVEMLLGYPASVTQPTLKNKKDTLLNAAIDSGNKQVVGTLLNTLLPIFNSTTVKAGKGSKKHKRKNKKAKPALDYSAFQRYAANQLGHDSDITSMLKDLAQGRVVEGTDLRHYGDVNCDSLCQLGQEEYENAGKQNLSTSPISFVNDPAYSFTRPLVSPAKNPTASS